MSTDRRARPPRILRFLVRLLIRGSDAAYIISDIDTTFARDMERGMRRGRAARRYAWNVLASAWSVWRAGIRELATHGIGLDAKLGLRMLAKQPLVTVVAGLALGLGIPASLTLVHAMDVIYGDLPVPDGERVVGVRHYDRSTRDPRPATVHDYERWMDLASLESMGAVRSHTVNVTAEGVGPWPVRAAEITASAFDVLRARPLLGRMLDAADEVDGAADVVLLGENVWSARFASDPDIVGTSVRIGRTPHTVVGVMPADFRFPYSDQIWLPFRARAVDFPPGEGPRVYVFGRLVDGVAIDEAGIEMETLTAARAGGDPERFEHVLGEVVKMSILLLNEDVGFWYEENIFVIQLMIFGLLLVVCGNVGTLILARTAARSAEITIRTALGASRVRILTQLFVEALVLAVLATGFGLVCANAFAGWLMQLQAPYGLLPYWADLRLTPRIVAIALGLATLCAALTGVLPALSTTRRAIQPKLQSAAARGGTVRIGLGSSLLIVSEIGLSVAFLAMGASTYRSVLTYQGANLGFDPDRYVVGTLTVPALDPIDSPTAADSLAWARRVEETQRAVLARLAEEPGVRGVGMGRHVPGLSSPNRDVILETPLAGFEPVEWDTMIPRVGVSFFAGLNRPIVAGRDFHAGDVDGPPEEHYSAIIVNESFVRHVLGGRNAIGQRLRYEPQGWGTLDEGEWYEIVGVVGAFGTNPRNSARDAAIYHPLAPGEVNPIRYTVQLAGDPEAFAPRFRQIAASVEPTATAETTILAADMRAASQIFGAIPLVVLILAGATFLLSASGVYALISFTVSQRTREIGIRTALGARATDIVSAVARRAALQIGAGLALGVFLGWVLLDNNRNDINLQLDNIPITLALTVIVAGSVCVLACARPTLRGIRIEPTEALRES